MPSPLICLTLGAVGASCYHFFDAFCSSPDRQGFINGIKSVFTKAPQTAGSFVFWSVEVFGTVQMAVMCLRQNQNPVDIWNLSIATAVTRMLHVRRRGLGPAFMSGLRWGTVVFLTTGAYLAYDLIDCLSRQFDIEKLLTELSMLNPELEYTEEKILAVFARALKEQE